jgi:uncharacterized membrane protein
MMTNAEITAQARAMLKGRWKMPILASAIFLTIFFILGCIPVIGWIGSVVVSGPLTVGYFMAYLSFVRMKEIRLSQLFDGFAFFVNAFLAYLLASVFIILWSLLLVIPGIIAAFSYALTFFILADNPGMEGLAAISRSKELMRGRKWKLFCLVCRFIGWFFLGFISLGIGFLWIMPYLQTSLTLFYEDLMGEVVQADPALLPVEPA